MDTILAYRGASPLTFFLISSILVVLCTHTKFQLSMLCRIQCFIEVVGFGGGSAAGGNKICLII